MGQGEAVWERFGHNALIIRDTRMGTDIAWNWGVFDFAQPNFLGRFLTGDTKYWVQGADYSELVRFYQLMNRALWLQELALTPAQKATVRDYVRWNAQEENKYYRYDYYRDNCSTRVRDLIDHVLGGALKRSLTTTALATTYRAETQRLLAGMPLTAFGTTIALGRDADRPLTAWDASFVPMRLRDALKTVQVAGPDGVSHALVLTEQSLFDATNREPEATKPPVSALLGGGFAAGLFIAGLLWLLGEASPRERGARAALYAVASLWWVVNGALGTVLLLAWTVTRHVYWANNVNTGFFTPLAFATAIAVLVAVWRPAWRAAAIGLVRGIAVIAVLSAIALVVPGLRQRSFAVAALVLPVQLMLAWSVPRALVASAARRA
jgi:hypothetical protein